MQTKEYPKDKYGYEIPRCHYASPINGEDCPDVPMTGEHFCPAHNPRLAAMPTDPMRRCHYINQITTAGCEAAPIRGENFCHAHHPDYQEEFKEAQRKGGRNRRQPEPPPRIPPNLPYLKFDTRADIQQVYEMALNFVLQGEMDVRVSNNIGYLAMGALMTIDSTERAERQARLDAERAANRAEDKAERKAEREESKAEREERKAEREASRAEREERRAERQAGKAEREATAAGKRKESSRKGRGQGGRSQHPGLARQVWPQDRRPGLQRHRP